MNSVAMLMVGLTLSLAFNAVLLWHIAVLREELMRERRLPWKRQK